MHGVIKERLFGNFFKDETRVSDENYKELDSLYKNEMSAKVRSHRSHRVRSTRKTSTIVPPDEKMMIRRHTGIGFNLAKRM
jgi:hypothetical protein